MAEDYHKGRLVRLRSDQSVRVEAHAETTHQTVPAVVTAALGEYLDRHDTGGAGGTVE